MTARKPQQILDEYFKYCSVAPTPLETIATLGNFLEGGLSQHIEWRRTEFSLLELRNLANELNSRLSQFQRVAGA